MEETPVIKARAAVTCWTDGCEMAGRTLLLRLRLPVQDQEVYCGTCGQQITDIEPVESPGA